MDNFSTSFPLLIITFLETMAVSWMYGWRRIRDDIASMLGFTPNYFWVSCWAGIAPFVVFVSFILKQVYLCRHIKVYCESVLILFVSNCRQTLIVFQFIMFVNINDKKSKKYYY